MKLILNFKIILNLKKLHCDWFFIINLKKIMIKSLKSIHKTSKGFTDFGTRVQYKDIADFFAKE